MSGGGSRCTGHGKTRYAASQNTIVPVHAATNRPQHADPGRYTLPNEIVIKP